MVGRETSSITGSLRLVFGMGGLFASVEMNSGNVMAWDQINSKNTTTATTTSKSNMFLC